jgi:hypothetical protein
MMPICPADPYAQDQLLMEHVQRLSESAGWHFVEGVGIHVAHQAGSFRSPVPRFAVRDFPYRTTIGEFKRAQNLSTWRILEQRVNLLELANPKQLFREELCVLCHCMSQDQRQQETI